MLSELVFERRNPPVVGWHGTSSNKLREILKKGLLTRPIELVYDYGNYRFPTLGGVYVTVDRRIAEKYAINATKKFGGKPVLIKMHFVPESAYVDEDHILEEISSLDYFIDPKNETADSLYSTIHSRLQSFFRMTPQVERDLRKISEMLMDQLSHLDKADSETPLTDSLTYLFNNDEQFHELIDHLTKIIKPTSRFISKYRLPRNVTFRGRNKIVSILDLDGNVLYSRPR